jgi:hypothetical protein
MPRASSAKRSDTSFLAAPRLSARALPDEHTIARMDMDAASMAASDPFAALPHALSCRILLLLSVQERARCALVCPRWCTTVKDHGLWLRLDLTRADGAECSEATLRGAAAHAGGQLQALRLACYGAFGDVPTRLHGALCAVVAANAGTLRELRVDKPSE